MDFTFTPEQDALREQARAFLAANPEPSWKELAELGWTGVSVAEEDGGAGLTFVEEAVLFEELGRALYRGPYFSTVALALPALPGDLRAEVASGDASWTLSFGPLVPDLDLADRVAMVGGDGIYELEGAEREVLSTSDVDALAGRRPRRRRRPAARRLGSARGDPQPLAGRARAGGVRCRATCARVRDRACARRASSSGGRSASTRRSHIRSRTRTPGSSSPARCRSGRHGALQSRTTRLRSRPRRQRRSRPRRRFRSARSPIQVHGGIGFTWEHVLHRLYKRALWIESFGASSTTLRAEVAASLLDATRHGSLASSQTPVSLTQGG